MAKKGDLPEIMPSEESQSCIIDTINEAFKNNFRIRGIRGIPGYPDVIPQLPVSNKYLQSYGVNIDKHISTLYIWYNSDCFIQINCYLRVISIFKHHGNVADRHFEVVSSETFESTEKIIPTIQKFIRHLVALN
jgi:hypothetical protein